MLLGDERDLAGKCKSIVKLNIKGTQATRHGIRLAVQHLSKLQSLDCDDSVGALAEMIQTGSATSHLSSSSQNFRESAQHRFPLMDLHSYPHFTTGLKYEHGPLAAVLQFCPFVVDLTLSCDDALKEQDMKALLNLENLRSLNLFFFGSFSCGGGMLPILQKFGPKSLERLELAFMDEVDVGAIVQNCSKLQFLELEKIKSFISSCPSSTLCPQLLHLHYLSIDGCEHDSQYTFPPEPQHLATLLLASPALTVLELEWVDGLTDQIIEEVVICHGFAHLQHFNIRLCPNITSKSIDLLLSLESPLVNIATIQCKHLKKEHSNAWKSLARKNNWEMDISWQRDERFESESE